MIKRVYEKPQIEIFDIKIEQGFAQSNSSGVNMNINGWGPGEEFGGPAELD